MDYFNDRFALLFYSILLDFFIDTKTEYKVI